VTSPAASLDRVRSVICERPEVADAFVCRVDPGERTAVITLSSYYSAPDLREHLADCLGEESIPEVIAIAPSIPRDGTGGVSPESVAELLRSPETSVCRFTAPRTPVAESLVTLWRQVLNRRFIGAADSFSDLGGDSLSAMLIINLIEEQFGVTIPLDRFLEAESVQGLTAVIDEMRRPGPGPATAT
jgi:acyl carrier protein